MTHHKKTLEERIERSKEVLKENLNTVRAGRANPALLDKVMVNYYGAPTPLKSLANISVPEPRTLLISPFDVSAIANIEHGINEANIGINPSNDGKVIRISIPPLTAERRKELVKQAKSIAENSRVAIRNIRRDGNDELKKQQKDGTITEDDLKTGETDLQKSTDKYIQDINKILEEKEKEILEG